MQTLSLALKILVIVVISIPLIIFILWITTMMKHKIHDDLKNPDTLKITQVILNETYFDKLDLNDIEKFQILEFWDGKIYHFTIKTNQILKKQFTEQEKIEKDSELSSDDIKMIMGCLGENIATEKESLAPWFREKAREAIKTKNFILYLNETHYALYDANKKLYFIQGISP